MSYKNKSVNGTVEESIEDVGCRAGSQRGLRGKILTSKNKGNTMYPI
jgi:hypothetical protein